MAECQEHGDQEVVDTATADSPELANVRDHWHWVKHGIEEILAEQPQLTFRPEDVYHLCLKDEAYLWVAPEGFVITTTEQDEFTGHKTLLLWLAWTKERGNNCAVKYLPFFEEFARHMQFQYIETRSPVAALEKYFVSDGWKKDTVIYTRAL